MKHSASFIAILAGVLPTLSFVIPDETVANQVFRNQAHNAFGSPQFEEFKRVFENLENRFEERVNDLINGVEKFEERFGAGKVKGSVMTNGAAILDDGLDAFYGFKTEQHFPETYEYFDGQGWLNHHAQSTDVLFASFPYEGLISNVCHKHDHHDHEDHEDHDHHDHHHHHDHEKRPRMPPHDPNGPHTDSTLFDIIANSRHTTKLAQLIKQDNDLVNMLKDPKANLTIFAPGDEAFKRLPKKDPKDVPKDLLKRVLAYHIAQGTHDSHDLIHHNTLLTKLNEDELGKGSHQRLRIGFGFHGPTVNFYSRLTMVDVYAKNGVIHGIDALLLPPPTALELVEILPTEFSTSEAAIFRTGLTDKLKKPHDGLTVFLPSNKDWEKLGLVLNAFLFSDKGNDYLKAIMKYHIVPGHTLYSDAYICPDHKKTTNDEDDPDGLPHGYQHASLPTLLKDRYISADITRYERFLSFRVNGFNSIMISDGIAKNGVIQVPDHVLIPPHTEDEHRHPPKEVYEDAGEMTVEELKARLAPFVDTEPEL